MKITSNIPVINTKTQENNAKQYDQISTNSTLSKQSLENFLLNSSNFNRIQFLGIPDNNQAENKSDFKLTLDEYFRFTPDKYQKNAAKSLYNGYNTIVTAPTGSGKTLVAEYVIHKNLDDGKKTIYTTPLKALSNQKLQDFSELFGAENVGLVTGDFVYNADAPVIVMTTEVYRNKLLSNTQEKVKEELKDVKTVIFDEFHYMNDDDRGIVWEESIMHSPEHIQILALSATIPNVKNIAKWLSRINTTTKTEISTANPEDRHVPLRYYTCKMVNKGGTLHLEGVVPLMDEYINVDNLSLSLKEGKLSDKRKEMLIEISKLFNKDGTPESGIEVINENLKSDRVKGSINLYPKTALIDVLSKKIKNNSQDAEIISNILVDNETRKVKLSSLPDINIRVNPNEYTQDLIKELNNKDMLPAIFFVFSKNNCNRQVDEFVNNVNNGGKSLLSDEETEKVQEMIQQYKDNNIFLGSDFDPSGLLCGVATHHAGMMPGYRDLVEKLFQQKLIKVVFATETLAAGINMPAKTTVITDMDKPSDPKNADKTLPGKKGVKYMKNITSSELKQMTGRAGRRGIDPIGNVVILNTNELNKTVELIKSPPDKLKSNFEPTYGYLSFFLQNKPELFKLRKVINRSFLVDSMTDVKSYQQNKKKSLEEKFIENERNESINNISDEVMNKFKSMSLVLKERKFIEPVEGKIDYFTVTPKGELASKVRGVNEILLSEMICDGKLNNLTPEGLAAVASTLINDDKSDKNPEEDDNFVYGNSINSDKVENSIVFVQELAESINKTQLEHNLTDQEIKINTNITPYIYMWAETGKNFDQFNDKDKSYSDWVNVINSLQHDKVLKHEGNFVRNINNTIDILNQIQKLSTHMSTVSEDVRDYDKYKSLANLAGESASLLKHPPVREIIWDYENQEK